MTGIAPRHRPHGQDWLNQMFRAKAAQTGGVIRRNRADVVREVGHDHFELEVRRRGFHLLICGKDYIVICSNAPVTMLF